MQVEVKSILGHGIMVKDVDNANVERAMELIENLPLEIDSLGYDAGILELRLYPHDSSFFLLSPKRPRVAYNGIQYLNPQRFKVSFMRLGFEGSPDRCVDELFVGYEREPYTGIFLRTHPFRGV